MEPALGVALLALLFVGTHVGLATSAVRGRLIGALGERGFVVVYSGVASATFAAVVAYYAAHRFEGMAGLAAGAIPLVRALLFVAIAAGIALAVAGLAAYPRMPMALCCGLVLLRRMKHSLGWACQSGSMPPSW